MIGESERLAALLGQALLEAIDRAVARRLPEQLERVPGATAPAMSVEDVAGRQGVSADTVRDWIRRRGLEAMRAPGTKSFRISEAALERFLSGEHTAPQPVSLASARAERARQLVDAVRTPKGGR